MICENTQLAQTVLLHRPRRMLCSFAIERFHQLNESGQAVDCFVAGTMKQKSGQFVLKKSLARSLSTRNQKKTSKIQYYRIARERTQLVCLNMNKKNKMKRKENAIVLVMQKNVKNFEKKKK